MSDGSDYVPCRCDGCGELVRYGKPGAEHWYERNGAWSDGRGGIKRGMILRTCKKRGRLQPIPKDTTA